MPGKTITVQSSVENCSGCPYHKADIVGHDMHITYNHICRHPMWRDVSPSGIEVGAGAMAPSWCPIKLKGAAWS